MCGTCDVIAEGAKFKDSAECCAFFELTACALLILIVV
jgi:hypothetical protein